MQPILPELEAKEFKLFVVAPGTTEDLDFLGANGFSVLLDPKDKARELYAVTGIPQTYFIDRAGDIWWASTGWGDASLDEFRAKVDELTGPGGG